VCTDLQEAQKFVEQLDYDYSAMADAAAAPQRSAADLLWYDYGGGVGGLPSAGTTTMLMNSDKRGGATQSSTGTMWFGPRLGRRKRRGGSASAVATYGNGGVAQPLDENGVGPDVPQEAAAQTMAAVTTAAVVSDMINNVPWILVPIIENSRKRAYKYNGRRRNAYRGAGA